VTLTSPLPFCPVTTIIVRKLSDSTLYCLRNWAGCVGHENTPRRLLCCTVQYSRRNK
jgi:hypothetical protein